MVYLHYLHRINKNTNFNNTLKNVAHGPKARISQHELAKPNLQWYTRNW